MSSKQENINILEDIIKQQKLSVKYLLHSNNNFKTILGLFENKLPVSSAEVMHTGTYFTPYISAYPYMKTLYEYGKINIVLKPEIMSVFDPEKIRVYLEESGGGKMYTVKSYIGDGDRKLRVDVNYNNNLEIFPYEYVLFQILTLTTTPEDELFFKGEVVLPEFTKLNLSDYIYKIIVTDCSDDVFDMAWSNLKKYIDKPTFEQIFVFNNSVKINIDTVDDRDGECKNIKNMLCEDIYY